MTPMCCDYEKKDQGSKRKSLTGKDALMCHQCQRSDKGAVVRCMACKRKRYCYPCLRRWYPQLTPDDFAIECPFCRFSCNCKSCLRMRRISKPPKREIGQEEKKGYYLYVLHRLLPWFQELLKEKQLEKEIEARLQGIALTEVKLQKAPCANDEFICCNYCNTSIPDFHRSCLRCSYDLCLSCCRGLREGCIPGKNEQCGINADISVDIQNAIMQWRANSDGGIPCPPEAVGGCGKSLLQLKHILPEEMFFELEDMANAIVGCGNSEHTKSHDSSGACPCFSVLDSSALRKAASREGCDDNLLYCPSARYIKEEEMGHFQKHWVKGEPVIVRDVLDLSYGLSWEPMVMWRALREKKIGKIKSDNFEIKVIDCLDWWEVGINIHKFFRDYSGGQFHRNGWPEMLQLNNWPPSSSLEKRLPRHCAEFISTLPLQEYTNPREGHLNLAAMIPRNVWKPDLGPKTSIAYGFAEELGSGDSVTKIHYEMSDAVNVLTHTTKVHVSKGQLSKIKILKKEKQWKSAFKLPKDENKDMQSAFSNCNDQQLFTGGLTCEKQILGSLTCGAVFPSEGFNPICIDRDELSNESTGGALWDIFRREDVPKLEEYLKRHFREFIHLYDSPVQKVFHPIHDQSFYLSMDHKRKLKEEYGIEPWSFVQKLGEAVFIPAGCPHQVRNLKSCIKVALNFVSPENVGECMRLTEGFRMLPPDHKAKEDKLEARQIALHAFIHVVETLNKLTAQVKA